MKLWPAGQRRPALLAQGVNTHVGPTMLAFVGPTLEIHFEPIVCFYRPTLKFYFGPILFAFIGPTLKFYFGPILFVFIYFKSILLLHRAYFHMCELNINT